MPNILRAYHNIVQMSIRRQNNSNVLTAYLVQMKNLDMSQKGFVTVKHQLLTQHHVVLQQCNALNWYRHQTEPP